MELLVAVDGSDEARNALAYASEFAEAAEASITLVHAVDPAVYDAGGSEPISTLSDADQRLILEGIEDTERRGETILEEAAEFASDRGLDVGSELVYGDPAQKVPEYAASEGFDGIYVGHRGHSERVETMLGSVAKAIVERSSVPVTVVR